MKPNHKPRAESAAKLPTGVKIGYGVIEIGHSGVEIMVRLSLLIFYTEMVGLEPYLAGLAISLGIVWDAVSDPIVGRFSDVYTLNGERRRPYFIPGSILLGIFVSGLFTVPQLDSQLGKFSWLLFFYIMVNTSLTITSVPHLALAGDMTKNSGERTQMLAWRLLFGNIGMLLGTGLPYLWQTYGYNKPTDDQFSAYTIGILCFVSATITYLSTWEQKAKVVKGKKEKLWSELKSMRRNKSFWNLVVSFATATVGLTLNSTLALFYYRYRLKLPEAEVRLVLLVFVLIFCSAIPIWVKASERVSKIRLIRWNVFLLGVMTIVAYPLLPEKNIWAPLLVCIPGGVFVGSIVLLEAAVADCITEETDDANFGSYFGIWKLVGKISRALSMAGAGMLLQIIGINGQLEISNEASWQLALLFGPGVGIFLIAAAILLKKTHAKV